jgi:glycerol 2-dehydrogenase (NADP+)
LLLQLYVYTFIVARGVVVIPKSVTPARIKENFTTIALSEDEIAVLSGFAEKNGTKRFINPPWGMDLGFSDGFGASKASSGI